MKLSILIPTLEERAAKLSVLVSGLVHPEVEIITDARGRSVPTGTKRNEMLQRATGDYVCHLDDDDEVSSEYISSILFAMESSPDVITFEGWMTTNGMNYVHWIIKLDEKYEARTDPDGVTRYYRFPNHLVPMKRGIASKVKFPDIWQGEDYQWAVKIQPMLKTSVHIPKLLYHYKFITNK